MKNDPPNFVCVTSIPSSYRMYEFELLGQALERRGIEFEVIFMAETETGRHWRYRPSQWSFRSRVAWGLHPKWRTMAFHFNPGILADMLRHPPTWLLVGGGWSVPTCTVLASTANRWFPQTKLLFWVEATISYTQYSRSGWMHSLKRRALSLYDAFVVPGQCSIDYLQDLFGNQTRPAIRLANFVDERLYNSKTSALRQRRAELRAQLGLGKETVFIWPARLIPEKGILEFLSAIANVPSEGFVILLAGDGPLCNSINELVAAKGMAHVRLLGHQDLDRLLELYALADVLLLPSPREPYGFVAVEALMAGLPLVVSSTIGALPEVLEPGINGWCFDPFVPEDAVRAMREALMAGPAKLMEMGLRSCDIGRQRFDGTSATESFLDDLLDLWPWRAV